MWRPCFLRAGAFSGQGAPLSRKVAMCSGSRPSRTGGASYDPQATLALKKVWAPRWEAPRDPSWGVPYADGACLSKKAGHRR